MRNRCVLVAVCFLVASGLLLCVGRESVAKQPPGAPDPAGPATSHGSVGHGAESAPNSGHPTAESKHAQPQPEHTKPVRGEPANPDPAPRPAERPAHPHPAASEPAGASGADHRTPPEPSKPARGEKVEKVHDNGPVSRPEHQRPAEQGAPVGQQAHGQGKPTEPPGKQISSLHKPAKPTHEKPAHAKPPHEKPASAKPAHEKPVHEKPAPAETASAKPAHTPREHPQGRPPQGQEHPSQGLGPQKPVGQDTVRPQPQTKLVEEPVDRGPVADPEHQRPTKQPTPSQDPQGSLQGNPQGDPQGDSKGDPQGNPQGSPQDGEGTALPEGAGSQGKPGGPPDTEDAYTPGNGWSGEPPGYSAGHSGHGAATDRGPDIAVGRVPTTVGMGPEGKGSGSGGTTANVPVVGPPPDTGTGQRTDRLPASASLTGHESGTGTRSTEGPARQPAMLTEEPPRPHVKYAADPHAEGRLPAEVSAEVSSPRSTAIRGEDPVKTTAAHSSRVPDRQVMRPSRAVETVAAAPEGGGRRSAGYGVRPAARTPFGSTGFFFGYLWDESSFPVQIAQDGVGSAQGAARGFAADETSHGGVLTQRGPPLRVPSPFSGFALMMGGAASGASSSGASGDPLLAVIFCCLCAIFWRGLLSRAFGAFVRPGTVPRLALERPG
jgi:hypothetical protein